VLEKTERREQRSARQASKVVQRGQFFSSYVGDLVVHLDASGNAVEDNIYRAVSWMVPADGVITNSFVRVGIVNQCVPSLCLMVDDSDLGDGYRKFDQGVTILFGEVRVTKSSMISVDARAVPDDNDKPGEALGIYIAFEFIGDPDNARKHGANPAP